MDIKPIKTHADYRSTLKEVEGLMTAKLNTPEGDRLDILVTLIQAYEARHYPIDLPDPIEAIKFKMDQDGLSDGGGGRGTGLENDTDRGYMCMMLEMCAGALSECTDLIVLAIPETADSRKGKKSTFSPGPRGNLPRHK